MEKNELRILPLDLAYIAGFFDGEGCIAGYITESKHPIVKIIIGQRRPETLFWIKETLGMGGIYKNPRGSSCWRIGSKKDVKKFISLILPYSKDKKKQLLVGRKLVNLIGKSGHSPGPENYLERMILFNQLKLLKKKGDYNEKKS